MQDPALVGIITVTFNSALVIEDFLDSCLTQQHDRFRLFVVDNNSQDDTLLRVSHRDDPRISVINNPNNRGVAEGNNQGIRQALAEGAEWVILLNNDTVFDASLVSTLVVEARRLDVPMLVPKMMYFDRPTHIWCAGGAFNRSRAYGSIHFGDKEEDLGQHDMAQAIEYSPTCCMLIHRSVFERIGLMDETYFVYTDDNDFCLRAFKAGVSLYYTPKAKLFHKVSSITGGKESLFTIYYNTRNRIYYVRKNMNRMLATYYIFAAEMYCIGHLIFGHDSWEAFQLRQKALLEGIRLKPKPQPHKIV